MKNEIYVGDLVQGKHQCDFLTKTYKFKETYVVFRENHEAIIDRETCELAQKIMKERGEMINTNRRHSTKTQR